MPKCLVLAPTRELAKQVEREIVSITPQLSTACIYGGVSMRTQEVQLSRGVDVVVGTPGRLIDCLNRGMLKLDEASFEKSYIKKNLFSSKDEQLTENRAE